MKKMGIQPSHVISLEICDSKIYERLEHRRFDPLSGIFYNTSTDPPTDMEIITRLIQSPEDCHPVVKKRLQRYKSFISDMEDEYPRLMIRVNADADEEAVLASICESLENQVK
jgi:adenylate kinase